MWQLVSFFSVSVYFFILKCCWTVLLSIFFFFFFEAAVSEAHFSASPGSEGVGEARVGGVIRLGEVTMRYGGEEGRLFDTATRRAPRCDL